MANNQQQYEQALGRGHSYSWERRWREAIREFEAAAAAMPGLPAPYAGLGLAYFELNQLDQALAHYKEAAKYSGGDPIYLRRVAEVQEQLGQFAEAAQTYLAMGEIAFRARQLDEATELWQQAVRLDTNALGAHQRLATVYQQRGLINNAVREYLTMARILQDRDEDEKALRTCQLALALDPRNPQIQRVLERIERGEKAFTTGSLDRRLQPEEVGKRDREVAVPRVVEEPAPLADSEAPATPGSSISPSEAARRRAVEQLAETILQDRGAPKEAAGAESSQEPQSQSSIALTRALDELSQERIGEAIAALERALQAGLHSAAAYYLLGSLYQERLRYEEAIDAFARAMAAAEYQHASRLAQAACYRALGQLDEAVAQLMALLKLIDVATLQKMGDGEEANGRLERLEERYDQLAEELSARRQKESDREEALAKGERFVNALLAFLSQADWEVQTGKLREQLDALSLGPSATHGLLTLADLFRSGSPQVLAGLHRSRSYARQGLYGAALEEGYRAIRLSPDYLPAHTELARLLARQGRIQAATEKLGAIGAVYEVRNDLNGAIDAYQQLLQVAPLATPIRSQVIKWLQSIGRTDEALVQSLELAEAYYQLADVERARQSYVEALQLAPRSAEARAWQARLLERIGDIDRQRLDWRQAVKSYEKLSELRPLSEEIVTTLLDLHYKLEQPREALRVLDHFLGRLVRSGGSARVLPFLKELVEQRPADPHLVHRLVQLHVRQGNKQEAIRLMERLAEAHLEAGQREWAIASIEQLLQLGPAEGKRYEQLLKNLRDEG